MKKMMYLLLLSSLMFGFSYYSSKNLFDHGEYLALYSQLKGRIANEKDVRMRNIFLETLLKLGKDDEAVEMLESELKTRPEDRSILSRLLDLSLKLKDYKRISVYANRILRYDRRNSKALAAMAKLELYRDNLPRAAEFIKRLKDTGAYTQYMAYSGIYNFKTHTAPRAEFSLLKAINGDFQNPDAHFYLALINLKNGSYFNAAEHLKMAKNTFFSSPEQVSRLLAYSYYRLNNLKGALKALPDDAIINRQWLRDFKGQVAANADFNRELYYLAFAMKFIPQLVDKPDSTAAAAIDYFNRRGEKEYSYARYNKALFYFYVAKKMYGRNLRALSGLIKTYIKLGLLEHAKKVANTTAFLYPDYSELKEYSDYIKYQEQRMSGGVYEAPSLKKRIQVSLKITEDYAHFTNWPVPYVVRYYLNMLAEAYGTPFQFISKPGPGSPSVELVYSEFPLKIEGRIISMNKGKTATRMFNYTGAERISNLIRDVYDEAGKRLAPAPRLVDYREELGRITGVLNYGVASNIRTGDTFSIIDGAGIMRVIAAHDTYSIVENVDAYSITSTQPRLEAGR